MTNDNAILELQGVRKRFGELEALKGVDLSIQQGEFFGFLGPNGAGKSTLMKIFSGFLAADEGKVLIRGQEVDFHDRKARMTCGLVPQEIALYDSISPLQNLKVFGDLYGMGHKQIRERSEDLLQAVGLWDRKNDPVKDFSGGMKRRLNIIASLLHEPDILLCDEPTVGVDPQSRNAIFTFLEALNKDGLTIVYTTHYMEEAERLCRRIAIIDHGAFMACGDLDSLLALSESTRELLIAKGPEMDAFVEEVRSHGQLMEEDLQYRLVPYDDARLSTIYGIIEREGIAYERVQLRTPSLESLFLQLTGHRLRD
ncbi:MAG: ABC transporter ATP-binding protein [Puniceicoccaceae bacterium]